MPKIYKMKDSTDSYTIKKPGGLWNLPMRLALVGRTGAGKTSVLGNLLLRKDLYRGDWEGCDIYVFSGSLGTDAKLQTIIRELEVPSSNCFGKYDGGVLHVIADEICKNYEEALEERRKPVHSLIILDDVSYSGALARNAAKDDALHRVCMNLRKNLCSMLVTSQKYSGLATAVRENLSGGMIGQSTNKQLDLITADHCYLRDKKDFHELFRSQTKEAHDYFCFNMEIPCCYLDHQFKPLPHLLREKEGMQEGEG